MGGSVNPVEALGFCLYRSYAHPAIGDSQLDEILNASRIRNQSRGLTGCLHHENRVFFQWLEGPRMSVARLVETLRDDNRHMRMTVLDQGPLEERYFPTWQMRFSDPASAKLMTWLGGADKTVEDMSYYAQGVTAFLRHIRA